MKKAAKGRPKAAKPTATPKQSKKQTQKRARKDKDEEDFSEEDWGSLQDSGLIEDVEEVSDAEGDGFDEQSGGNENQEEGDPDGNSEDDSDSDSEEEQKPAKKAWAEKAAPKVSAAEANEAKKGLLERILSKANPTSLIRNKMRREEAYRQLQNEKSRAKKKLREQRQKEREALGDAAPPLPVPKTLDNTREKDVTTVDPTDEEVHADQACDEFKDYFDGTVIPKILISSSKKGNKISHQFCTLLEKIFPRSKYVVRQHKNVEALINIAKHEKYTDVMVVGEHKKDLYSIMLVHLPFGPTAFFRLTSVQFPNKDKHVSKFRNHHPELILNNFTTRLGHTVGRMISAMFPQQPNFRERRVITFHNQRDFIFFRHHVYMLQEDQKADLKELGPRFTMKLKYLQKGLFDPKNGEYVWKHKPELHTSRRRFFL